MSLTYKLVTVADLLKVPPERRGACMRELEDALALMDLVVGEEGKISTQGFTWCDDGDPKSTIKVGEEELTLQVTEESR